VLNVFKFIADDLIRLSMSPVFLFMSQKQQAQPSVKLVRNILDFKKFL